MGQGESKESVDPCATYMQQYLTCVEKHTDGLSENDDCGAEAIEYKKCRARVKELKNKTSKQ